MLIVAHRGASALARENTMAAFERALADGAPAVEFDVRLTADERLVIVHDDDLVRTTGHPGRVCAMTLAELLEVDADIPTFEQVLDLLAGKVTLCIEVKGAWTGEEYIPAAAVVDAIAPLVRDVAAVVSSFDVDAVSYARRVLPSVPTGLATLDFVDPEWTLRTAVERGFDECHLPEAQVTEGLISRAHEGEKRILAWTVNDPLRARELAAMQCDGLFTDDPKMIASALKEIG